MPSTSNQSKEAEQKCKKFRDNAQNVTKNLRTSSITQPSTSSQIVTKRLLRSIKRRQMQHPIKPKMKRHDRLKHKLIFLPNNEEKSLKSDRLQERNGIKKSNIGGSTLEEGELRSADERVDTQCPSICITVGDDLSDEDCICIEPEVDQIIIDDDAAPTSSQLSLNLNESILGFSKFLHKHENIITSTPCIKSNAIVLDSVAKKDSSISLVLSTSNTTISPKTPQPLFFKDTSKVPWFDTTTSSDNFTDYTRLATLHPTHTTRGKLKNKNKKRLTTLEDEVIVLDDTTLKPNSSERKSSKMDNSVIFVGETSAAFIPLVSDNVPNPIRSNTSPPKRVKTFDTSLFTASEKKQLTAYNSNTYNPDGNNARTQSQKRLVIIDGSNVAYNHALNNEFSVKGLKICIEYFEKMGHTVKAVVPQFRLQKYKSSDPEVLNNLHKTGKIVLTPCKNLPGKSSISYDDRFVLQLACELDAAVVSNDNYRDLINENSAFKKIIENRVIGYTWCNDIFILPKDPYGKWGPGLHSILNRT